MKTVFFSLKTRNRKKRNKIKSQSFEFFFFFFGLTGVVEFRYMENLGGFQTNGLGLLTPLLCNE